MLNRFEQFSSVISGIQRDIQRLERDEMVQYGYKGAYAQYLVVLRRSPEGLTAAQLCEICDKDKAAVSRISAEMAEKGLLLRDCAGGSRYRALLKLTARGREAADHVCRKARAAVAAAGSSLTDEERDAFYRALTSIASGLQALCREGIPSGNTEEADPSSSH